MQHLQLLTLQELAQLLGRSPETIRKDLRRNPPAVPQKMNLPGTRLLRWRATEVENWLSLHAQAGQDTSKKNGTSGGSSHHG